MVLNVRRLVLFAKVFIVKIHLNKVTTLNFYWKTVVSLPITQICSASFINQDKTIKQKEKFFIFKKSLKFGTRIGAL